MICEVEGVTSFCPRVMVRSVKSVMLLTAACASPLPEIGDEATSLNGETGHDSTSGDGATRGATDSSGSGGAAETRTSSETGDGAETTNGVYPPEVPLLELSFTQIKQFEFGWEAVVGAEYYQLYESSAFGEMDGQIDGDLRVESIAVTMPLHLRLGASYQLQACNSAECTASMPVSVTGSMAEAVGYFKASNTDEEDRFGNSVALSSDGSTLAISSLSEDSNATGIGGDQRDDSATNAGAVYIMARNEVGDWEQQAYVKASNTDSFDSFGWSLALSADGSTLAVSTINEGSAATGIDGDDGDNSIFDAGAVYVFVRDPINQWSQQAYIKASNAEQFDRFGMSVDLSSDGDTLVVGASEEGSNATGINGDQSDNSSPGAGAVYVFVRDSTDGQWQQQAYLKASNAEAGDLFGSSVALSADGNMVAVGAEREDGNAAGINGNSADNSVVSAGAVYIFVRSAGDQWAQQSYIKASNPGESDRFGRHVVVSDEGDTLAVGVRGEDSGASGINGNQADESASGAGAVYVFVQDPAGQWAQQAYVKASNVGANDWFGHSAALSTEGDILAVGAYGEASSASGIGGNQADDSEANAGAVYVFVRDVMGQWSQEAYVKASNAASGYEFGTSVGLSGDGNTLAVGSINEASSAIGIGGDQTSSAASAAGAVYLY